MKRLVTLLLAASMLFALTSQASALEVNVSGQMVFQFGFRDNYASGNVNRFTDAEADHFFARQRVRLQIEFIASENLRGVLQLQMGTMNWGSQNEGAALDTTSSSASVRQAYIDWNVPDTALRVKMGLQLLTMPNAVSGTPIMDTTVAAIVTSLKATDNVTLGAFWARPYTDTSNGKLHDNQMDLFSLLADFNYDSFRIQPYLMYGRIGADSGWKHADMNNGTGDRYANLYMGGVALSIKPIDKLTINFDGIYGSMKSEADNITTGFEKAQGWFTAFGVDYDLDFATLGMLAWYGSGDDKGDYDDGEMGVMPTISQGNSGFRPTRLGSSGFHAMGDGSLITSTGTGTWGFGAHLKNFSFVEDLTHSFRAVYFQGTHDKELYNVSYGNNGSYFGNMLYLTEKDNGYEINLDSAYDVGDGFKVILDLSYIYVDWYKKKERGYSEDNIWNAQITFDYRF